MKTSKPSNPQATVKAKYLDCQNFMDRLWKQVSPRTKLSTLYSPIKNQSSKKTNALIYKSTRFTSPNSYQSSELVSRKASRQKDKISKNFEQTIKKKRKRKVSSHETYDQQKQNQSNKINSEASQQFKISRWKNKVLKEFVLKEYKEKQNCCINFLQKSLKLYQSEQSFKSSKQNSVLGYLAGEREESANRPTLTGVSRVITIDWMYLISTSLLLNRQTIHLAIHYLDNFLLGETPCQNLHIIAAAAMLLSVKQEQRESQSALLATVCMSQQFNILKDQVIESEKAILRKLNFRLKSNTLAFWIDYFSSKWDLFIESNDGLAAMKDANISIKLKLRSSDGESYRLYRELMELSDVMLMFSEYTQFHKSKLALSCIYLVVRIEWERLLKGKGEDQELFKVYHKQFLKKASPIFKDPFRVNQILNSFLAEMCEFQITEIIPAIKLVANFLNVDFCYNVDEKAIEETKSYEDFMRRMTYSFQMKDFCLLKVG